MPPESILLFQAVRQEHDFAKKRKMLESATHYMRINGWSKWRPWQLMPIVISFTIFNSLAIRGAIQMDLESFRNEGLSWFSDLAEPDPFVRLGIITAGLGLFQTFVCLS